MQRIFLLTLVLGSFVALGCGEKKPDDSDPAMQPKATNTDAKRPTLGVGGEQPKTEPAAKPAGE